MAAGSAASVVPVASVEILLVEVHNGIGHWAPEGDPSVAALEGPSVVAPAEDPSAVEAAEETSRGGESAEVLDHEEVIAPTVGVLLVVDIVRLVLHEANHESECDCRWQSRSLTGVQGFLQRRHQSLQVLCPCHSKP